MYTVTDTGKGTVEEVELDIKSGTVLEEKSTITVPSESTVLPHVISIINSRQQVKEHGLFCKGVSL